MSIYSTRPGINGSRIYLKDKLPVKKTDIPANIFAELTAGKEAVDDSVVQPQATVKFCVFCKAPCTLTRFVNMQTVYMCEQHYHDKTIGQVVQQLRENNYGSKTSENEETSSGEENSSSEEEESQPVLENEGQVDEKEQAS